MPFPHFKPGKSGNPNGRPRKYITQLKEIGYKKSEITDTIEVMIGMTLDELKKVYENKEATILEKTIAAAMKKGIDKGDLSGIETLITRLYGKPKQDLEITGNPIPIQIIMPPKPDDHPVQNPSSL